MREHRLTVRSKRVRHDSGLLTEGPLRDHCNEERGLLIIYTSRVVSCSLWLKKSRLVMACVVRVER